MIKTIQVTEEDICEGIANDPGHCPVALASKRCTGLRAIGVGTESLTIHVRDAARLRGRHSLVIDLPGDVLNFIRRFDNKGLVEPFSFDLDIPGEVFDA